jgi:hypothetical protein
LSRVGLELALPPAADDRDDRGGDEGCGDQPRDDPESVIHADMLPARTGLTRAAAPDD